MILFCLIFVKLEQFEKVIHGFMLSYFCKTKVRCGKLESVAPVAQWIRASVFGTEGRGFESLRVYHFRCKPIFYYKILLGNSPT